MAMAMEMAPGGAAMGAAIEMGTYAYTSAAATAAAATAAATGSTMRTVYTGGAKASAGAGALPVPVPVPVATPYASAVKRAGGPVGAVPPARGIGGPTPTAAGGTQKG